jgi:hypothetical protein
VNEHREQFFLVLLSPHERGTESGFHKPVCSEWPFHIPLYGN